MTASQLAARVLRWALDPQGPVPSGILAGADALARPTDELRALAGAVAARHLARLRWHAPPLGDDRPVSGDLPLLATLVAQPKGASALLPTVDLPVSRWDWVARDALVAPALRSLAHPAELPPQPRTDETRQRSSTSADEPSVFADELRRRSPLSALQGRPAPGDEDRGLTWLIELAAHRDGQRWLRRTLGSPVCALDVLTWRVHALDRLRHDPESRSLVLDIYAEALVHHAEQLLEWTALAMQSLTSKHDPLLAWSLTLSRWWGVLVQIDRADPDAIRGHQAIDPEALQPGLALAAAARNLTGVAA